VINGQVVDTDGTPVRAAKVHAELLGRPMAKAIRYVTADDAGTFLIDRLAFGTSDNYWNGSGTIWGEYNGFHGGELREFGFFVGSEEEYMKTTSR
jgi:hypothetical protein